MSIRVESVGGDKTLETIWTFVPSIKKFGVLKFIEQGVFGGGYTAKLVGDNGKEIKDKVVWEKVEKAMKDYEKRRKAT